MQECKTHNAMVHRSNHLLSVRIEVTATRQRNRHAPTIQRASTKRTKRANLAKREESQTCKRIMESY